MSGNLPQFRVKKTLQSNQHISLPPAIPRPPEQFSQQKYNRSKDLDKAFRTVTLFSAVLLWLARYLFNQRGVRKIDTIIGKILIRPLGRWYFCRLYYSDWRDIAGGSDVGVCYYVRGNTRVEHTHYFLKICAKIFIQKLFFLNIENSGFWIKILDFDFYRVSKKNEIKFWIEFLDFYKSRISKKK